MSWGRDSSCRKDSFIMLLTSWGFPLCSVLCVNLVCYQAYRNLNWKLLETNLLSVTWLIKSSSDLILLLSCWILSPRNGMQTNEKLTAMCIETVCMLRFEECSDHKRNEHKTSMDNKLYSNLGIKGFELRKLKFHDHHGSVLVCFVDNLNCYC